MAEQAADTGEQLELIAEDAAENLEEQASKETEQAEQLEKEQAEKEPEPTPEPEAKEPEKAEKKAEKKETEKPEKTEKTEKASGLRNLLKTEKAESARLQGVIQGLLDALTKDLSKEDKELLTSLGGDRADAKLNIFNRLKSAGKIGTAAATRPEVVPEADRTRVAAGDGAKAKPKGWKEADNRMSRKLKQVR
jgi:hypothetical protein